MRAFGPGTVEKMVVKKSSLALSDAILLGSVKHPQKMDGFYTTNIAGQLTETCAIVAALDCIGVMEEVLQSGKSIQAWTIFPTLSQEVVGCPECHKTSHELVYLTEVATVILHLNDDHHWTRPRIAEWVKSIEDALDMVIKDTQEQPLAVAE